MWSHRTLGAVALLGLASCDRVLGLQRALDAGGRDAGCIPSNDHDEDGDGVLDSCDPCPGVAGATHSSDLDEVPDACDPRPQLDGDWLAQLITFAEPEANTRWKREPGWTIEDDALRFADPSAQYLATLDSMSPFPRPFAMTARVVIDALPTMDAEIALLAADNLLLCGLQYENGTSTVFVFRTNTGTGTMEVPTPTPLVAGAEYVLELVYDPASAIAICRARDSNNDTAIATITNVEVPPPGPIGFEGKGIAATIEYAAIYRWP